MAIKNWCGDKCAECNKSCILDQSIPCSPDCEKLTEDENIKIAECLKVGCEEIRYIFDMVEATDEEIIDKYGTIAPYPYNI